MLSSAPTCDIGRGAAKAQAFHRGNVVVVLLRNPLTVLERTLVSDGRGSAVHHLREEFASALAPQLIETVQTLTGCSVEAFMSAEPHRSRSRGRAVRARSAGARPVPARGRPVRESDPAGPVIVETVARSHRLITRRGPSRTQAFHDEDLVVVLLDETLTVRERTLVDDGDTHIDPDLTVAVFILDRPPWRRRSAPCRSVERYELPLRRST